MTGTGMGDEAWGMGGKASPAHAPSPMPHASPALVVFAKVPVAGTVKTRLVPPLSFEQAADLYAAFLADALAAFVGLGASVRLYRRLQGGRGARRPAHMASSLTAFVVHRRDDLPPTRKPGAP